MADKRISQLAERVDIANNDVVAIVASGATVTNKATISSIQAFMQGALDVGVTSVGVTISETDGEPISVVGSPITTSGNITINLPRATNSIRGVLDSEDFINFNNKQGTISLTTSGTSGDATFDGSLLNIPNYTTDTSGFVTLDTDQTITGLKTFATTIIAGNDVKLVEAGTASTTFIKNISGNALTSQGSNGFGFNNANNIYFSGSNKGGGVFAFNNTGSPTYTLPTASGTLALTSDLTGFVTLDTAQTITGAKVFSQDLFVNGLRVGRGLSTTSTIVGVNAGNNSTGGNNSFFGLSVGRDNTTGSENSFFGDQAGIRNTTGSRNSFFGHFSANLNISGNDNSFFGYWSGRRNTGLSNSFFGSRSGQFNSTGIQNSFFGASSGNSNTTGIQNSFFGASSGNSNTTGNQNSFFGISSGLSINGSNNSFFGNSSAVFITTGSSNSFFGNEAGRRLADNSNLTIANNSIFIGRNTKAALNDQTNQIVIGNNAVGVGDNSVVLGHTTITKTVLRGDVGIGTTSPGSKLSIVGLPTSSAGLSAGDIFNDNGTLKIV